MLSLTAVSLTFLSWHTLRSNQEPHAQSANHIQSPFTSPHYQLKDQKAKVTALRCCCAACQCVQITPVIMVTALSLSDVRPWNTNN